MSSLPVRKTAAPVPPSVPTVPPSGNSNNPRSPAQKIHSPPPQLPSSGSEPKFGAFSAPQTSVEQNFAPLGDSESLVAKSLEGLAEQIPGLVDAEPTEFQNETGVYYVYNIDTLNVHNIINSTIRLHLSSANGTFPNIPLLFGPQRTGSQSGNSRTTSANLPKLPSPVIHVDTINRRIDVEQPSSETPLTAPLDPSIVFPKEDPFPRPKIPWPRHKPSPPTTTNPPPSAEVQTGGKPQLPTLPTTRKPSQLPALKVCRRDVFCVGEINCVIKKTNSKSLHFQKKERSSAFYIFHKSS